MEDKELIQPTSSMNVDKHGARLKSLVLGDHKIVGEIMRGDGKPASTHNCTPNFGPAGEAQYGLKQHGDSRNNEWEVVEEREGFKKLFYEIKDGTYPRGMEVTQTYTLESDSLKIVTTHENTGSEVAPVNFAHHLYWLTQLGLGWDGVKVNGVNVTEKVKANEPIAWKEDNIIEIPGKPAIRVQQQGLPYVHAWARKKEEGEDKSTGEYDTNYVALEPCENPEDRFGEEETMIDTGNSRTTELTISLASEAEVAALYAAA